MRIRTLTWILFRPVLALMLLSHCFGSDAGYDVWRAPSGQPEQMWSQVRYDRKLTDTFFESDRWGYPYWIWKNSDGTFTNTRLSDKNRAEDPPRLTYTARCFSTSFGVKHVINFCEARRPTGMRSSFSYTRLIQRFGTHCEFVSEMASSHVSTGLLTM
jgi:hypothetical protein